MNGLDWLFVCCSVAVFGGAPAVAAIWYLDRKQTKSQADLSQRLDAIADRLVAVDTAIVRSFTETIRKVQAEIKSLEIVFRGSGQTTRENPESVDSAIRLAREGVSSDLIVAKTGLPVHAVESIISLHGRR